MHPEFSIVVPVLNEVDNVRPLFEKLKLSMENHAFEVIFADDLSTDGTSDVLARMAEEDDRVVHLLRRHSPGLSRSVIDGFEAASGRYLAVIDGDLQHDETRLPVMFDLMVRNEADVVVASRYEVADESGSALTGIRHMLSKLGTSLSVIAGAPRINDPMSGFFALKRDAYIESKPRLSGKGYKILLDILTGLSSQTRIGTIPYVFGQRTAGESKLTSLILADYLAMLAEKRFGTDFPGRFLMFCMVGATGIGVHLLTLTGLVSAGLNFSHAHVVAIVVAITSNFYLNNRLTWGDQPLRGRAIFPGYISFAAICMMGAFANASVAFSLHHWGLGMILSSLTGVLVASIWNFSISRHFTWNLRTLAADPVETDSLPQRAN